MAGLDRTSKSTAPSKFAFLKDALTIESSEPSEDNAAKSEALDVGVDEPSLLPVDGGESAVLRSRMQFDEIKDRQVDTRPIDPYHVDQLAESIAILGLLEPLVVDLKGVLLAGGHRKAALRQVRSESPEAYALHFADEMIPVRVMPFDAKLEPDLALQIEVSENEKRRDYTPAEIRLLAERLKKSGYTDAPGRPAKGEKRLKPAIEVIVGKSLRQVRRILNNEDSNKTRTHVRVSQKQLILEQLASVSERWLELPDTEKQDKADLALTKQLTQVLKGIRGMVDHSES
jgi:ParB family transcriptional regulator, chromosome partitioning protein